MKRADTDSVAALDHDMAGKNLSGYWTLGMEGLPSYPMTQVELCLWKWADVYESLVRAGELISLENSERRVVRLVNPGLDKKYGFATHTIQVSFQYVKPGENARAHRHTPAALRFVIQGKGAYTTVNGQQCMMEPGDLILTPALTWHDHSNESSEPMLWLDGLDFPLVTALHQVMQERFAERRQPVVKSSDDVASGLGDSIRHGLPLSDFFTTSGATPKRRYVRWRHRQTAAMLTTVTYSSTAIR
jgi:gentisate 1,2-dioxygenase